MTTNERIYASAIKAANGLLPDAPTTPGLCLAFVRVVVEKGLGLPSRELYRRWLVAGTTFRPGDDAQRLAAAHIDPWANDMQASMKKLGLGVPYILRQAGDLIFATEPPKPFGHVGILLSRGWVLELIAPGNRPTSINLARNVSVTPIGDRKWSLVARLRA